ncbi:TM2 domain-containing protein [Thermaerobacillus caldiproteolyticus]|uniref:TM2 domain-containing membrane protein YozV n=1 Tax=Thermaerobacillus caldiproteolyticus TaxID=247480 RepID=A0A7V9Z535_9BACL|nr:NINE protein [Anoxybacillus caldiproteolyticus]MBA2874203.1 TM2 domain-containing membrane protein YozV [Anoxybacillus caldiproteolyticus]QPA31860.1 NINE protein [Anoxybacillus caldiproteolyticus]
MKNKIVAGLLAILLGGLGIHKFYLGKLGQGILYLLFSWTGIPSIIGFIEGILYLVKSDEKFNQKYNYHLED